MNPGEDTIVCTMTQNNTSEDGIVYTSTITMTLYFANNNFARVSVRGESVSEGSSTPTVTTMDMSAPTSQNMSFRLICCWEDLSACRSSSLSLHQCGERAFKRISQRQKASAIFLFL